MKAFLSHQFRDNISEISNLLVNNGVEVFDSMVDIEYGSSFQKSLSNAIKNCDFVVLIYSSANPNIAFEAGIAVALKKPIFTIVSTLDSKPDFLLDSTCVHAQPSEIDKLRFNLNIFLKNIKPRKRVETKVSHEWNVGGNRNKYKSILNLYNNIKPKSERNYENLFQEIFYLYNLNIIKNKIDSKVNFCADFSIWSDKLNNVIGNPILIEVKNEINKRNINKIKNSINQLINTNHSESYLIFYDQLYDINKKDLPNTSRCLFIQILDLIEKLKDYDFDGSIRAIRNEIAHSQD